jgi:hypothetical protein
MRWRDRLAFHIWKGLVVTVLLVAYSTVAEGAPQINEKTKCSPVFLCECIGIVDSSSEVNKQPIFWGLSKQFKICKRSRTGAKDFRHTFRKEHNSIGLTYSAEGVQPLIQIDLRVIPEELACPKSLAWHPTLNVESRGLAGVLNAKSVRIHGWKHIVLGRSKDGLTNLNFNPWALIKPELLNALPKSVSRSIGGTLGGIGALPCRLSLNNSLTKHFAILNDTGLHGLELPIHGLPLLPSVVNIRRSCEKSGSGEKRDHMISVSSKQPNAGVPYCASDPLDSPPSRTHGYISLAFGCGLAVIGFLCCVNGQRKVLLGILLLLLAFIVIQDAFTVLDPEPFSLAHSDSRTGATSLSRFAPDGLTHSLALSRVSSCQS